MNRMISLLVLLFMLTPQGILLSPAAQTPDPTPPTEPIKLIFIHHSTGGNWLADPAGNELGGDLGRALMENNYYVSATNYGWGPDSIGDATDIPNWVDWFRGERSAVYLDALYRENGQNFGDFGSWPRLDTDPGGENQIIVFKSCFPNSELEGSPGDAPDPEGWLSVGHAKYVYNEILQYFATRPDKLFVVITAPPLSSSSYSANARAFNEWLVNDWLNENHYPLANVAVFDFYNVLTAPNAHHRLVKGQVEHIVSGGQNTLYYPSGDDHPSQAGNRKATEEFVPMLNMFYNRWKVTAVTNPLVVDTPAMAPTGESNPTADTPATVSGVFSEDFENGAGSWEAYDDGGGVSRLACAVSTEKAASGSQSLKMDFSIAADGWGTCSYFWGGTQNWSTTGGLTFAFQSASPGALIHVDVYAGPEDNRETYYYTAEVLNNASNWTTLTIPWGDFKRAEWEENGGSPFTRSDKVVGIAIGFPGNGGQTNTGVFWIDDIRLSGAAGEPADVVPPVSTSTEQPAPTAQPNVEPTASEKKGGLPFCGGAMAIPFLLICGLWLLRLQSRLR